MLPHETALGVLKGMVQRFDQEAAAVNLPVAASQVHLTESQVIIMASLVQAEGGRLSDYPKIARVIYNRLAQGMPLQLDSTVLYGLNTYGILANDQQLNSPSPYNTYRHKGLPPGPIDSPGNAAIQAVLHPASGQLGVLRDREPEDRRDPVHLEPGPVPAVPAGTPAQPRPRLTAARGPTAAPASRRAERAVGARLHLRRPPRVAGITAQTLRGSLNRASRPLPRSGFTIRVPPARMLWLTDAPWLGPHRQINFS